MRNVIDKYCKENQNTFYVKYLFSENRAVYEIMSKNVVQPGATNDVTVWLICVAYWISKTTRKHAHAHGHASANPHARKRAHTRTNM